MAVWAIIIMVILVVAIGIFVSLTYFTESANKKNQQANILYPFSGYLAPSSGPWSVNQSLSNPGVGAEPEDGMYLVGMVGGTQSTTPQIKCPTGYSINVVGAFLDVTDPYGECSNTADSMLQMTCGDGSDTATAPSCDASNPASCGAGMTCYSGKCTPMTCTSSSDCGGSSASNTVTVCGANLGTTGCKTQADCGSGLACVSGTCMVDPGAGACMACVDPTTGDPIPSTGGTGFCASMPTCTGVVKGLNNTCSPSGTSSDAYKCRPRDASAYLAAHCDGKSSCMADSSDMWIPNVQGGLFGPLPCQIPALSSNSDYASLPIITGWGGGTPDNTQDSTPNPATFNQGYYIHGIYTCVSNDENALTSL